jgi:hypothetical protein
VDELAVGHRSELRWTAFDRGLFGSLPTEDGQMPYLLKGEVTAGADDEPEVVVAVNGVVAGSLGLYGGDDGSREFWGLMGPWFVPGANAVVAYDVERTASGPVLHRLDEA